MTCFLVRLWQRRLLLRAQGRVQEAAVQYAKLATFNQDSRNPSALVAYGDLLSADMVVQANQGGRNDARPHRTTAFDAYARALRTQPLKTIGVALLPGHRCWLCCNSSHIEVSWHTVAVGPFTRGRVGMVEDKRSRAGAGDTWKVCNALCGLVGRRGSTRAR